MGDMFGGESEVTYSQSPQQAAMWKKLKPMINRMVYASQPGSQYSLWDMPQVPQAPQAIAPTAGWFGGLDPSIKQGLWEPYNEALNILGERMGSQGQYGSARGGYTNAFGEAAGKMGADYANQIGLQAWNMYAPYQNLQQERDWTMAQNMWASQLEENKYPYAAMPGLLGGTYASPVVSQSPNIFGSLANMGMAGAMMYGAFSDIRLKRNVKKVGSYRGMDVIEFNYAWDKTRHVGLIAQQVLDVVPEAVSEVNGYLCVDYRRV